MERIGVFVWTVAEQAHTHNIYVCIIYIKFLKIFFVSTWPTGWSASSNSSVICSHMAHLFMIITFNLCQQLKNLKISYAELQLCKRVRSLAPW